jgi:peptidyl-prolyl cis-trans isomerase C
MNDILYHAQVSKDLEPTLKTIIVSDNDVNKYYSKNPEYRASQILLRLRANPNKEEVKETYESALNIYKAITDGADSVQAEKFGKAVYKYSQTNNAVTGGDLGYQPKTKLTPEFYAAIKGKKKGSITKPFRSQYGYHIVQVLGVKTAKQIDKKMYKKIIYDIKRDKLVDEYFVGLRKKAKIKINKDKL